MKNLLDELRNVGLSDNEARKSIEVVYEWVEERYPVLAAVARTTVTREMNAPFSECETNRDSFSGHRSLSESCNLDPES